MDGRNAHRANPRRRDGRSPGFTLIEMLTTVAALVIILGLMVSLARYVRSRSADTLTRQLLLRLEASLGSYDGLEEKLLRVPPLLQSPRAQPDEAALQYAALDNNKQFIEICNEATASRIFAELPLASYDGVTLRDAWGTPLVYMPRGATNIGMAPRNQDFLLSAGPDRKFTSLLDNLYSYERPGAKNE